MTDVSDPEEDQHMPSRSAKVRSMGTPPITFEFITPEQQVQRLNARLADLEGVYFERGRSEQENQADSTPNEQLTAENDREMTRLQAQIEVLRADRDEARTQVPPAEPAS